MTNNIRLLLCALAVAVPAGHGWAADPEPPQKGKVAVLENDHIMQGDIQRVGEQYRVRRTVGETWLPADRVRHLCADLEGAYAYLRSQANLNDADECLRLARWGLLHGLRSQALVEAKLAVALRPSHAESTRLVRSLERPVNHEPPPRARDEPLEPDAGPMPNLAYNPDSMRLFVSRIQPILMNTCASCHANGKGGTFKLARGHEEGLATNQRTTQQNLMATLAQLNRDRPKQSSLLLHAITVHGDADKAPLKGRSTPAYRTLEEWAQLAIANTPRAAAGPVNASSPEPKPSADPPLPAPAAATAPPKPATAEVGPSGFAEEQTPGKEPGVASKPAAAQSQPPTEFARPKADSQPAPSQRAEPADPFDPVIFNRQMHADKK